MDARLVRALALPCTDCAYMVNPGLGHRVLRGASWDYPAGQQYVADRVHDTPYIHYTNDGFRCANRREGFVSASSNLASKWSASGRPELRALRCGIGAERRCGTRRP